ncbi:hypothetical protein M8818_003172 [Zalaria obscura]|uniref:Uncharacterized protein n=1 Tax=Zalaria obscura TaxID=2024903 RepID=A0ACC3SFL9_9PEZI
MVDYYDKYDDLIETRLETEKPSEVNVKPSLSSDGKASAIVLTRRCTRLNDENGAIIYKRIPGTQVMQIYSKELIEALQGIVDVRTVGAAGQESLRLREPFEQVVRNLSSLQQKASQSENQTLKEQFELLSGVLHELYPKLERERALHGGSPAHYAEEEQDHLGCCRSCRESRVEAKRVAVASQSEEATFSGYYRINADTERLTDHQYMLFTNRVPAFYFQDREWVIVNIAQLIDYTPSDEGFRRLVRPEGHSEIIEALIKTRKVAGVRKIEERYDKISSAQTHGEAATPFNADLVAGKGNGLIILLHGAPGVGKTSTAECVAEMTNLPLYPITCGDIGIEAKEVEDNLRKHFELAQLWNAVVLLDEADVFLQARNVDSSSLRRNSLVSVFPRVLEYYEGILILTTNRVGDFDEAFTSRIHVMLHYPELRETAIQKIWKDMRERLEDICPDIILTEPAETYIMESKEVQKTRWNGRQVRNAFQTAITLAEYEATKGTKDKDQKIKGPEKQRVDASVRIFYTSQPRSSSPCRLGHESDEFVRKSFGTSKIPYIIGVALGQLCLPGVGCRICESTSLIIVCISNAWYAVRSR